MTPIRASLLVSSLAAVGVAQAQTAAAPAPTPAPAPAPAPPKADSSLTWNGITLYGIVDVGLQYQTHGVPINVKLYPLAYLAGVAAMLATMGIAAWAPARRAAPIPIVEAQGHI